MWLHNATIKPPLLFTTKREEYILQSNLILKMYRTKNLTQTIYLLKEMQNKGMPLSEAIKQLYSKENFLFDDLWPAVMSINMVSEKEAMQLTKEWCSYYKNR